MQNKNQQRRRSCSKDPIQSFRNAILEQVPCESSEKGPLFLKKDVIEWMQKKTSTDQMFIYRLNSDFVEDYMRLHSTKTSENEKVSKEDFFKLLAKEILEDIASTNLEEMRNMPFIMRGCLSFCGFELNKNKNTYDKNGRLIPFTRYAERIFKRLEYSRGKARKSFSNL